MRIIILSATPMPADGIYTRRAIAPDVAQALLNTGIEFTSYVGHLATAEAFSQLLGVTIPTNRGVWRPEDQDVCLAFSTRPGTRLAEGQILQTVEEVLERFDLCFITYETTTGHRP